MPTATLAPSVVDPIAAIATAGNRERVEAVETLRSAIEAINLGESFDTKEVTKAMRVLGMSTDALRGHAEALKSAPTVEGWDAEYPQRLAAANELQAANTIAKQEEKRLQWVAMVKRHNKAADELRMIVQENQQVVVFKSENAFLFDSDLANAAEAADAPAITRSEAASISAEPFPAAAADQLRKRKLALRQQTVATNAYQNATISKVNTDVPMR